MLTHPIYLFCKSRVLQIEFIQNEFPTGTSSFPQIFCSHFTPLCFTSTFGRVSMRQPLQPALYSPGHYCPISRVTCPSTFLIRPLWHITKILTVITHRYCLAACGFSHLTHLGGEATLLSQRHGS